MSDWICVWTGCGRMVAHRTVVFVCKWVLRISSGPKGLVSAYIGLTPAGWKRRVLWLLQRTWLVECGEGGAAAAAEPERAVGRPRPLPRPRMAERLGKHPTQAFKVFWLSTNLQMATWKEVEQTRTPLSRGARRLARLVNGGKR